MKEKDLIDLGFERTDVNAEESGDKNDWHYYTYDFDNQVVCLISNDSDEAKKRGKWYAEIFDDHIIRFTQKKDLKKFIKLVEKNIIK